MPNESSLELESELRAITPHQYPNIIKLAMFLFIVAFGYVCTLVPSYINAAKQIKKAQQAYTHDNYDDALEGYLEAFSLEPSSKTVRIGLAKVLFKSKNPEIQMEGLGILDGLEFTKKEMVEIRQAMPRRFEKFFESTKK